MTTYAEIIEFIDKELSIESGTDSWRKSFRELNLDSLEMLSLLQALEEKFSFNFDRECALEFKTPQDVLDWIREDHLRKEWTSTTSAH